MVPLSWIYCSILYVMQEKILSRWWFDNLVISRIIHFVVRLRNDYILWHMYVSKSCTTLNSSNTGKHFDHCTLKSILLLCINAFKTWCERCFCGEKIERPFPNNVHTATLSVNCIETELTFVSKTCAVFYRTTSIRPETCRLLVHLQSSWWTFALFCDDITACNRIEFWINLFHNTSRDWIYDII